MKATEWPSSEVRDIAAEIAVNQNLDGGHLSSSLEEFWRQLGLANQVEPNRDTLLVAKGVADSLGLEFDDDYLDLETNSPSLSLYEDILVVLRDRDSRSVGTGRDSDSVDTEDDDTGVELTSIIADVPALPWTIRETMNSVREGSLVLNPEWQRGFVWKLQKERRLIESILLGLPIPSFLLFEDSSTGRVFVIDGRQRLETIFRFMSPREKKGEPKVRFKTFNSKTIGWLPGQALNVASNCYFEDLPEKFRNKFEKAPLTTFTFKDISPELLYQIFKRYNTGAVALNAAEIRNAVYQASPLHGMMFRMGGEYRDASKYQDQAEAEVGETIRQTMPKGKLERYGAYDFIGRYFAFMYQSTGSVASATNAFMQRFAKDADRVEPFRLEFIRAMEHTLEWYDYPLVEPRVDGAFHAMLGAIQLVSTTIALSAIENDEVSLAVVRHRISSEWQEFATKVLQEKQNSTLFWNSHALWNAQLIRP